MTIHIEDLRFKCIIGLLDFERHIPQEVIINLQLDYDYLYEFINYADLALLIEDHLQEKRYELLETALTELLTLIKQKFPLTQQLQLKISKPNILTNCQVSVSSIKVF